MTTLPPISNSNPAASPMATSPEDQKGFGRVMSDLSKKLARRSGPEELVQKNILKEDELASSTVSSTIISQKLALEEERKKDALNRRLGHRPSKVDLKLRNILRVDSSDALDAATTSDSSLSFTQRQQSIKSILKKRPERTTLQEMNIIKPAPIGADPSIIATAERLRRHQLEDSLNLQLAHRPLPDELEPRILVFSETVEVLPTFRKSEYNRKPDNNSTFKKLTPAMKSQIREELNTFKKHEMPVHENSLRNTCFH